LHSRPDRPKTAAVRWFLLAVVSAALEIALLIFVASRAGVWPTLGMLALSAAVGVLFARSEGLRVWRSYKEATLQGRLPEEGILSGLLVLAGGGLLILPGFVSDAVGLLLLIPPTRRRIAGRLRRWLSQKLGPLQVVSVMPGPAVQGDDAGWYEEPPRHANVIDTEGVVVETERLLPAPRQSDPEEP
jgi:UPF0716 protein FxsA